MKTNLTIRNCPVGFRFRCPKLWDQLAVTDHPAIRHCDQCNRDVYYCVSDEETIDHAKAGRCIAREVPDGSELPPIVIGHPARPSLITLLQDEAGRWAVRDRGIDDSIHNATRTARSCPRCSYPAPAWRKSCRVCGFEMGRAGGKTDASTGAGENRSIVRSSSRPDVSPDSESGAD